MSWVWLILACVLVGGVNFVVGFFMAGSMFEKSFTFKSSLYFLVLFTITIIVAVVSIVLLLVLNLLLGMTLWLATLLSIVIPIIILKLFHSEASKN